MEDRSIERMLNEVGVEVGSDGGVALLHGAPAVAAVSIVVDRRLIAGDCQADAPGRDPKPRIFVATDATIAADHDGVEVLVPVRVVADDLHWHRTVEREGGCPPRHEFVIEGPECRLLDVGKRAYDDPGHNAGPAAAAWLRID